MAGDKLAQLRKVLELAAQEEDRQARALGSAQQKSTQEQQRLQQLFTYQKEYSGSIGERERAGMSAVDMARQRAFLGQLVSLEEGQRALLERAQAQVAAVQAQYLEARGRRQALEKLIEQRQQQQLLQREKRESAVLDDLSANQWLRRRSQSD